VKFGPTAGGNRGVAWLLSGGLSRPEGDQTVTMTEFTKRTPDDPTASLTPSQLPPEYPKDLERDVVTDGLHYMIRPIVPADGERLVEFHRHLSPDSRYLRFFSYHPTLSSEEVERFTQIDYSRRLALVALADGELIGVGRYEREPGTDEAEVAFVVADAFHRHGIATLLLDQLVVAARQRGVTTFVATTMWENHDMLSVFLHSGFDVVRSFEGGVVSLRFPIRQTSTSRWALAMRDADRQVTPHADTPSAGER
jgi:GNAT superfamily N-acetyltransferase